MAATRPQHLLDEFLTPDAAQFHEGDPRFDEFTFNHDLRGAVALEGSETGELSLVSVEHGQVRTVTVSRCSRGGYQDALAALPWERSS